MNSESSPVAMFAAGSSVSTSCGFSVGRWRPGAALYISTPGRTSVNDVGSAAFT